MVTPRGPDLAALSVAIDQLRARLRARHGWTHLAVELVPQLDRRVLSVRGQVAIPRLAAMIERALTPLLPAAWTVDLDLRPLAVARWCQLPAAGVALWAEHPSQRPRHLATELEPGDGPVAELARDDLASLIRARDGTVGWIDHHHDQTLETAPAPRPLPAPVALSPALGLQIHAHARAYLGVPYELGGATQSRIDCSALVQRALGSALGVLVPRNSHDQLAAAGQQSPAEPPSLEPGDLWFIHSRRMQRLHVGILGPDGSIIHASKTRGQVIEEPRAAFEGDASWQRAVGWIHLRAWACAQVGRDHLELPPRIQPDP